MIDYNKEFYGVVEDLEVKFDSHFIFVSAPDNTIKASINLGNDTFIALALLLRAKSAINKKIEELINSEDVTEIKGESCVKENEK